MFHFLMLAVSEREASADVETHGPLLAALIQSMQIGPWDAGLGSGALINRAPPDKFQRILPQHGLLDVLVPYWDPTKGRLRALQGLRACPGWKPGKLGS